MTMKDICLILVFINMFVCFCLCQECSFEADFCGWSQDNWKRTTKSDYSSAGPPSAYHGQWFIQNDDFQKGSLLNIGFQKPSQTTCLKFRYHIHGSDNVHLEYGFYQNINNLKVVSNLSRNENFWHCSTFSLNNMADTDTGIYFRVWASPSTSGIPIVALDNILLAYGTDCDNFNCPQGPVITTQKPDSTSPDKQTVATEKTKSGNIAPIVGGAVGGAIGIFVIIVVICVIRSKNKNRNEQNSENRNLSDESWLSIAESSDRKFSQPSVSFSSDNTNRPLPTPPPENIHYMEIDDVGLSHSTTAPHNAESDTPQHMNERTPIDVAPDPPQSYSAKISQNGYPPSHGLMNGRTYVHVPPDYPLDDIGNEESQEENETRKVDPRYRNTCSLDDYLKPIASIPTSDKHNKNLDENAQRGGNINPSFDETREIDPNYRNTCSLEDYLKPVFSGPPPVKNNENPQSGAKVNQSYDSSNDDDYLNSTISSRKSKKSTYMNTADDDYLEPNSTFEQCYPVPENQYESDPTGKDIHSVKNHHCLAPSDIHIELSEIPAIPGAPKDEDYLEPDLAAADKDEGTKEEGDSEDYLVPDSTGVEKTTDEGDSEDYLVPGSSGVEKVQERKDEGDSEDYFKPDSVGEGDSEDYIKPDSVGQGDSEDYIKPDSVGEGDSEDYIKSDSVGQGDSEDYIKPDSVGQGDSEDYIKPDSVGEGDSEDYIKSDSVGEGDSEDYIKPDSVGQGDSEDYIKPDSVGEGDSEDYIKPDSVGQGDSEDYIKPDSVGEGDSEDYIKSDSVGQGDSEDYIKPDSVSEGDSKDNIKPDSAAVVKDEETDTMVEGNANDSEDEYVDNIGVGDTDDSRSDDDYVNVPCKGSSDV